MVRRIRILTYSRKIESQPSVVKKYFKLLLSSSSLTALRLRSNPSMEMVQMRFRWNILPLNQARHISTLLTIQLTQMKTGPRTDRHSNLPEFVQGYDEMKQTNYLDVGVCSGCLERITQDKIQKSCRHRVRLLLLWNALGGRRYCLAHNRESCSLQQRR